MMSWLTRPESPQIETREPAANGGRISYKNGTPIDNVFFTDFLKKNKGTSYIDMAKTLNGLGYISEKGNKIITPEALERRANRAGFKNYGSKYVKTIKELKKEATPKQLDDLKKGLINEDTFRNRINVRRNDLLRSGSPERLKRAREYNRKIYNDPKFAEQKAKRKLQMSAYKAKEYLRLGIPPEAKTAKQFLFRDLFTIAQKSEKGDRLKIAKKLNIKNDFKGKNFYNNVEVVDTKTGKKFNYNNVEKYISPKNTGYKYEEVIKPYEQKVFINNQPGLRTEINSKMIKNWNPGLKDNYFEVQHVEGRYKNPFNVHLSTKNPNMIEGTIRNRFDKAWGKTSTLSEKKNLFKDYTDNLPKGIASQPGMITRTREFGERVPFDKMLRETKQSGVKLPRGVLKEASILKAKIPGITDLFEMAGSIKGDLAKKKYLMAGAKSLGVLATPLIVYGAYDDFNKGIPVAEIIERNLIGTDLVKGTKEYMSLSPEGKEARSVVKQSQMTDQIAQDESLLDSDFETPKVKSDLTIAEAEKQYKSEQEAFRLKRESEEARIAKARAISMSGLKDLMTGERFQPQQIPTQTMANGGIMRLIKKFTNDK